MPRLRFGAAALLVPLLGGGLLLGSPAAHADDTMGRADVVCRFSAAYREVSGLAASTQHPGVLWLHEDSGSGPWIHAIDATTCATLANVRIAGAQARDFEAIGMGTMPDGTPAIWLGDIGDNQDSWPWVEVLRIREPRQLGDRTVRARTFRIDYPDRPHNAETLLVHGSSLWIVTKQLARGALYRLPEPLRADRVNTAVRVQGETGLVTDGAIAPDGSRYVLRDYFDAQLFAGLPPGAPGARVDLPAQRQGEAITFSADGTALYVASEQDRRLIRIPVDRAPSATASSAPGSASPSASTPPMDGSVPSSSSTVPSTPPSSLPWGAIGVAAILIAGVFAVAERMRRRG